MRKTIGILAHVDAGKTTFSEQLLAGIGALRVAGRVDRGNTLLDSEPLERARGITIHTGQTDFLVGNDTIWWLDTPGHPDFVAEVQRALPAMDAAVLLLSCRDGVQPHTETLWKLLAEAGLPTFVFLNKTDLSSADPVRCIRELRMRFSPDFIDLRCLQEEKEGNVSDLPDFTFLSSEAQEELALRDDNLLELISDGNAKDDDYRITLVRLIAERRIFPVFAGAALRGLGILSFARVLFSLVTTDYDEKKAMPFSAVCHCVHHLEGKRYCGLKLLSGSLFPRDSVLGTQEKVNTLFRLRGPRLIPVPCANAGDLVLVPGLSGVCPGDRLGENVCHTVVPSPILSVNAVWNTRDVNPQTTLSRFRELEEEDPTLHIAVEDGRISLSVAGPLQLSVIEDAMYRRFSQQISFGPAKVIYRETIATPAVGIGHYEPLRHYAETHLRLVPAPRGSGIRFRSLCSVNDLPLHWQRLIETHIFEREWPGVLTGAPLTDVVVELLSGRAHPKHTEGGDFREATGRALRCALMNADCVLLEPVCRYRICIPTIMQGSVSSSLALMRALPDPPETDGENILLTGECRLACFLPWQEMFPALTHGRGSLSVELSRYAPCEPEEQQRRVTEANYNPLAKDTPDSVFCSHGAGIVVSWQRVPNFAHISG